MSYAARIPCRPSGRISYELPCGFCYESRTRSILLKRLFHLRTLNPCRLFRFLLQMSAPARPSNTAEAQRKRRACANYGQNAAGKWVRKTAWRACDYIDGGQLRQFDTEEAFLTFEEERRAQGHSQAHYEKLPRGTVPKEQLALEEAITNAVAKDGNETRVHLQSVVEGLLARAPR